MARTCRRILGGSLVMLFCQAELCPVQQEAPVLPPGQQYKPPSPIKRNAKAAKDLSDDPKADPTPHDVARPPGYLQPRPSGLYSRPLRSGQGPTPGPRDYVLVHYTGWTTNGRAFDSSRVRDKAQVLRVDAAIPGWVEGLQMMTLGEQRRFWLPPKLAFLGDKRKPQGMVVFDIELLKIRPAGPVIKGDPDPPGRSAPLKRALAIAIEKGDALHCLRSRGYTDASGPVPRPISTEQAVEQCYRQYAAHRKDMTICRALGDDDQRLACTNDVIRARGMREELKKM